MNTFGKISVVVLAAISTIAVSAALATSEKADNAASILNNKNVAPYMDKASAIIFAPELTQGSLFRLRGAGGPASFTRKGANDYWCDVADVRLLAGDFGGNTVGVSHTGPVVLIALNQVIAKQLSLGQDIVGDDYVFLDIDQAVEHGLDGVDMLVAGSGHVDRNYIVNPGSNMISDIVGTSSTGNSCQHVSAQAAIAAH
jgi:hypothetical protein